MKYYGGCDVGSTYTKAVILDENGKICADTTSRLLRICIHFARLCLSAGDGIILIL